MWAILAVIPLSLALSPLGRGDGGVVVLFWFLPLQGEGQDGDGVVLMFGPLGPPPSSTAGPGVFGEDCLRPQAEFRSRPVRRAAQGTPKGRTVLTCFFGPLGPPPSSAAKPGDFCEDCLSAKREFRSSPAWRATQGTRSVAKGGGEGRLSLVPFFGRLKKGTSPPGYPRHLKIRA